MNNITAIERLLELYKGLKQEAVKRAKSRLYRKLWEERLNAWYLSLTPEQQQAYRDEALNGLLERRRLRLLKRYRGRYDRAVVEKEDGTKIRYFFYRAWWRKA